MAPKSRIYHQKEEDQPLGSMQDKHTAPNDLGMLHKGNMKTEQLADTTFCLYLLKEEEQITVAVGWLQNREFTTKRKRTNHWVACKSNILNQMIGACSTRVIRRRNHSLIPPPVYICWRRRTTLPWLLDRCKSRIYYRNEDDRPLGSLQVKHTAPND